MGKTRFPAFRLFPIKRHVAVKSIRRQLFSNIMKKFLVICTGNSCRSVMTEALINHYGQDRLQAFSAGSHPIGKINAGALATLKRNGLPTDGYRSQSWDEFEAHQIDIAITVCDNAAGETCPVYLNSAIRAHWGVSDPGHVKGSESEIIQAFDETFDLLTFRVKRMLELPIETMKADHLENELNSIAQLKK